MPKVSGWLYPTWLEYDDDEWHLLQGSDLVGEAYKMANGTIRWHCKTSDWRDSNATTIEQAKAECEADFWKEAWHRATGHNRE